MNRHSLLTLILMLLDGAEPQGFFERLWQALKDMSTTQLVGAGGVASGILFAAWKGLTRLLRELKESRDKTQAHFWNLVPWLTPKNDRPVIMLRAINRGAFNLLDAEDRPPIPEDPPLAFRKRFLNGARKKLSPAYKPTKGAFVWTPEAVASLRDAQRYFIPPACSFEESSKPRMGIDGVRALLGWISEAAGNPRTELPAGRFWVFGPGSGGKTIFMNRLFLELIGAGDQQLEAKTSKGAPLPVPMLASAAHLREHLGRIEELKRADDVTAAFARVWLETRNIDIPEHLMPGLAKAFKSSLTDGRIILVLDGVDELKHQDLEAYTTAWLANVKYWVASNRPPGRLVDTRRSLYLEDAWTYDQIVMNLDRRIRDPRPGEQPSPMLKTRETFKQVVRELIDRHEQAVREGTTDQEHHWLCQPRNLELFLKELKPEMSERDIRRLADSQPLLFRDTFERSLRHIKAVAQTDQIRDRLFDIAVNDPTAPRDPNQPPLPAADPQIDKFVLALTEITQNTRNGPAFRHAAMRDYFVAGRIAREILDPSVRSDKTDELVREDRWDSLMRDAVRSWLGPSDGKAPGRIRSRLRRRGDAQRSDVNATMRRNLLDLLLAFDRATPLEDLDFSSIQADGIDFKKLTFRNCTFANAELRNADLGGATFSACDFSEADLSGADALDTRFESCTFESNGKKANLNGMAIGAEPDDNADTAIRSQWQSLKSRGAVEYRSRYRDEFGEAWPAFQKAALGPGFERLEGDVYLPAIKDALRKASAADSGGPVYLVDLMAGGSYDRITNLLDEFENLRIVGVDKDPSTHRRPERLSWEQLTIGGAKGNGQDPLGLDLRESLTRAFGASAFPPDVIVGKKAIHEIKRPLQKELIARCADALSAGGRLVLFADAPGPTSETDLDQTKLEKIHGELESLRNFLTEDPPPDKVLQKLETMSFDDSPTSQIGFTNTWIMLKDWVNHNRHEVANRYFASVAEIKGWAASSLGEPSVRSDAYRLNPLIFNELGIQSVLHHIASEQHGDVKKSDIVARDRRQLQGMISENERLNVLIEFSRRHLDGLPLGTALKADERPIMLRDLDPALAPLDTGAKAWSFELSCHVLVFEKDRHPAASFAQ
jgi:uncharacterized protein YjbI with pentapeptide repeats